MRRRALPACALALLLSACATSKPAAPQLTVAPPAVALTPRDRERRAVEWLNQGRTTEARAELMAALKDEPAAPVARELLMQMDNDPRTLLGEKSFSYKVQRGETFAGLAARFLDDPYLFYALARYNGVTVPSQSQVGVVIRIPGEPKRAAAPAPRKPAPTTAAATPPKAPAAPVRDPAQANQLRAAALGHMSRGTIDSAIQLLRKAQALDPANPLIRRDLERAVRIQATVRARG